jgi:hypothetical protein
MVEALWMSLRSADSGLNCLGARDRDIDRKHRSTRGDALAVKGSLCFRVFPFYPKLINGS